VDQIRTVGEFLGVIRRRFFWMALIVAMGTLGAIYYALSQPSVNRRAIRDLIRGVNGGHCVCCFAALWRVCLSYSERVPKRMLAARPALF
jgi:hypothetical protein